MSIEDMYDYLIMNAHASEETLQVVININGYSKKTLQDVLYATTGYRSIEQLEQEQGEL